MSLLAAAVGVSAAAIAAAASNPAAPAATASAVLVVQAAGTPMPTPASTSGAIPNVTMAPATITPTTEKALPGINISGGEFGTVPGTINTQYIYPSSAEIDYFYQIGFKMIRIPFRWERLQPALYGGLSAADRKALFNATNYATAKGMTVVLDMHDYARRRAVPAATTTSLVGSAAVTGSALSNAWTQIMADYRDNPKVWVGLMNEPNGLSAVDWWRSVQQVVTDLRGQRITNKLMIPGVSWTGAHSWVSSGNSALAEKFNDPGNNYAFEVHQYLDKDSSGTSGTCTAGAAKRVDAVVAWAEAKKVKLFFGEIAGGVDAQCQIEYPAMLAKLNGSSAVIGWTAWGAGKWWNTTYPFRLAPLIVGVPTPHMMLLQRNLPV